MYGSLIRFSWSRSLQFRTEFWLRIGMDTVFYATNILFFKILYLHSTSLGGLTEWQAVIFVGSYLLVDAFRMTFFVDNFWMLRQLVATGDFDFYLVRPVSALFFITLRGFSPASFVNLFMAVSIVVWGFVQAPVSFAITDLIVYALLLGNGVAIYYILHIFFALTVFWSQSQDGIEPLFYILKRFGERPHAIYPTVARGFLLTIVPFGLIASLPVTNLFGGTSWNTAAFSLFVTLGMSILAWWGWRRAIGAYSSASS